MSPKAGRPGPRGQRGARGLRGTRGERGVRGERGPGGAPGQLSEAQVSVMERVVDELRDVLKAVDQQLERFAALQEQVEALQRHVDELRAAKSPRSSA
jgi:hypothetical protein